MQFETAWYYLNLIGFKKLDPDYAFTGTGNKRHGHKTVRLNIEQLFTDDHVFKPNNDIEEGHNNWVMTLVNYHEPPPPPKRDKKIKIKGKKVCVRCGGKDHLEREHKIALKDGGKDVEENLQWLCSKCHDLKHAEEKVLWAIEHTAKDDWRREMWQYRLESLRRLNPPEAKKFTSYWDDPKTHWSYWDNLKQRDRQVEIEIKRLLRSGKKLSDDDIMRMKKERSTENLTKLDEFVQIPVENKGSLKEL